MRISWNGCWEIRNDRAICRWMIAWVTTQGGFIGCAAGYSGGGSFQLERFYMTADNLHLECDFDYEEIAPDEARLVAEDCQDFILGFHDANVWLQSDNLILNSDKQILMKCDKDLLYGSTDTVDQFKKIFIKLGLTAQPI
jgi:hypothetical protein